MRAKKYHLLINQSQAKNNASFWLSMIRNLSAIDMLHDLVAKLPGNLKLKLKGIDQKLICLLLKLDFGVSDFYC